MADTCMLWTGAYLGHSKRSFSKSSSSKPSNSELSYSWSGWEMPEMPKLWGNQELLTRGPTIRLVYGLWAHNIPFTGVFRIEWIVISEVFSQPHKAVY